ncbi:uncharacterized protein CLUP02_14772 [Colletotrichum lupini]|uniref:Uncharacterized protein n=1 Tax=Colletotrichum lupini TaxID=145971 RepID=A0A9Q8WMM9_9PEZI|nr:uncharacterized protein CLUP02_14772 [Colletotrichum lupini]UQC89243.1 hypothetical protein CLUP02_14772 [Colletotrichum lupini]
MTLVFKRVKAPFQGELPSCTNLVKHSSSLVQQKPGKKVLLRSLIPSHQLPSLQSVETCLMLLHACLCIYLTDGTFVQLQTGGKKRQAATMERLPIPIDLQSLFVIPIETSNSCSLFDKTSFYPSTKANREYDENSRKLSGNTTLGRTFQRERPANYHQAPSESCETFLPFRDPTCRALTIRGMTLGHYLKNPWGTIELSWPHTFHAICAACREARRFGTAQIRAQPAQGITRLANPVTVLTGNRVETLPWKSLEIHCSPLCIHLFRHTTQEFSASKALHEIARWRLCRHLIRRIIRAGIHSRGLSEGGAAGTCLTSHFGVPLAEASPPLDQIPGNHVSFLYTDGPVAHGKLPALADFTMARDVSPYMISESDSHYRISIDGWQAPERDREREKLRFEQASACVCTGNSFAVLTQPWRIGKKHPPWGYLVASLLDMVKPRRSSLTIKRAVFVHGQLANLSTCIGKFVFRMFDITFLHVSTLIYNCKSRGAKERAQVPIVAKQDYLGDARYPVRDALVLYPRNMASGPSRHKCVNIFLVSDFWVATYLAANCVLPAIHLATLPPYQPPQGQGAKMKYTVHVFETRSIYWNIKIYSFFFSAHVSSRAPPPLGKERVCASVRDRVHLTGPFGVMLLRKLRGKRSGTGEGRGGEDLPDPPAKPPWRTRKERVISGLFGSNHLIEVMHHAIDVIPYPSVHVRRVVIRGYLEPSLYRLGDPSSSVQTTIPWSNEYPDTRPVEMESFRTKR